jgi:hypothetical protein
MLKKMWTRLSYADTSTNLTVIGKTLSTVVRKAVCMEPVRCKFVQNRHIIKDALGCRDKGTYKFLSQGRETVSRHAHNVKIEGSTPSPAIFSRLGGPLYIQAISRPVFFAFVTGIG